jgi:hypothetical protein
MKIINSAITRAWSRIPTLGTWVRVGVELPNHDRTWDKRREAEIIGSG